MDSKLGFEAAGGMVEKILPGVSFPVLMNAVLPGAVAAGGLLRIAPVYLTEILRGKLEDNWLRIALLALAVMALGGLISSLNSQFYKLYEGRIWPAWLFELGKKLQQWRVDRLYKRQEKDKNDTQRYNEAWYELRIYPIDTNGLRYASHPTLIGNLLYGYEDYPRDRYGMDSVFYWSRLWLVVDKDTREEVSTSWSLADGLLNLSGVSVLVGLLWGLVTVGYYCQFWGACHLPLHAYSAACGRDDLAGHPGLSLCAAFAWILFGYVLYRLSLPFHRNNGEVFKSLFDIYRDKLRKMTSLAPNEKANWNAAWAYLQYLRIRCPKCKSGYVSIYSNTCSKNCAGATMAEVQATQGTIDKTGVLAYDLPADPAAAAECRELIARLAKLIQESTPEP